MIDLRAISKRYAGANAVDRVSLRVEAGEFVAILGESGSGKTTLLKMINRLIEPDGGEIFLDGRDARSQDPVALRRTIGYVIQHAGLFPHITVGENVATVPRLLGWPRAQIDARVDELLALVDLPPATYRARLPDQLSGGQRQRVGIARALAAKPRILLLDEPLGALDPITRASLQRELRRLHEELKLTTAMVTHDLVEALTLADRIAVMHRGALKQFGTARELLDAPADAYVEKLMGMVREHASQLAALAGSGSIPSHPPHHSADARGAALAPGAEDDR